MAEEFEKQFEEDTSEKTEEEEETLEEEETSEKREKGQTEKQPDWKAKADAMYAKYKDAKETIEELRARVSELEEKEKPKKEITKDEWKEKVDFLLANRDKGYTEEEFNHISTVAKEFDISLDEAALLEEDYIQYRREKVAKEKEELEPSTKVSPSKVPIEQTPPDKLKELTPEEREEYYKAIGIKKR